MNIKKNMDKIMCAVCKRKGKHHFELFNPKTFKVDKICGLCKDKYKPKILSTFFNERYKIEA